MKAKKWNKLWNSDSCDKCGAIWNKDHYCRCPNCYGVKRAKVKENGL